ncbi:MAG: DUF4157 domain-containing protein [Bryobacteraceae bacterium]
MLEYQQRTVANANVVRSASLRPSTTGGGFADGMLKLQRQYGNQYVQRMIALARKEEGTSDVVDPNVEQAITQARGSGQPLDPGVRRQMEGAFGADFGGVRLHNGPGAHSLNTALQAVAFTTGSDIFFRDGAYNPSSSSGKELLAHELTHVVQQGSGKAEIQGKLALGAPGDRYEQEADLVAKVVVAHLDTSASAPQPASAAAPVQRQCACGGSISEPGGECPACQKQRELREAAAQAAPVRRRENAAAPFSSSSAGHDLVQRAPFDPEGPDNVHCKDKVTEDGAACADHVNTACSVGAAATGGAGLLIGAGIGSMIAPGVGTLIGGAVGGLVSGIGGALAYGKCVEKMNAACRARTNQALKKCDQQFPAAVGAADEPADQPQVTQADQSEAVEEQAA